jgi:hypothetical protein
LNNDEEVYWEVLKIKTGYYRSDISEVIGVFATPFYDGNLTKVDLDWYALIDDDDESTIYYTIAPNYIKIIKTKTPFQNVDDLFTWYNEFYLPEVYKSIFSLLPKARKNIEKKYEVETQGQFRSLRENIKRALREVELTEKCWKGYTQKGMKTMFGKRYPNCVKKTKK